MNDSILAGRSPAFPLGAALQAIETNGMSGVLRLGFEGTDASHGAKLGFVNGHVVAASDRQSDEPELAERVFMILRRVDSHACAFSFHPGEVDYDDAPLGVTALLLEAARRADEANR